MEAPSYTDTILLEANRKSSAEYLSGNLESKSTWLNDLGSGVKLDIGDTISVHSAYISEIGNENSTIEVKGRNAINNLGERQTFTTKNVSLVKSEGATSNGVIDEMKIDRGNYDWEYTESENVNQIRDDEINLTHSYYKCSQGDNYMTLPRRWATKDKRGWFEGQTNWSEYDTTSTGLIEDFNPYRLGTDYSEILKHGETNGYGFNSDLTAKSVRTSISHDGRRYTLFVRKSFKNYVPEGVKTGHYLQGERDPALMDFIWYKKTINYKVSNGFNSPANVASQITDKMTDASEVKNISFGEDLNSSGTRVDGQIKQNNINLEAQSNTFEIFPCSTAWFIQHAGVLWFEDKYNTNVRVPLTSGEGLEVIFRQNQFTFDFDGSFEGNSYTSDSLYTDGYLRPGWKFRKLSYKDTDNPSNPEQDVSAFDYLKGSTITSLKEVGDVSGTEQTGFQGTACAFNKENPVLYNPDNDTSFEYIMTFSNEHLPMLYESCYSTIGYLRPEIQEAGRELMEDVNYDRRSIDGCYLCNPMTSPMANQNTDSTILTGIPWTNANLLKLKKLFETQSLYPELFDYDGLSASQKELINIDESTKGNLSVNTMRFLHMNDSTQETETDDYEVIYTSASRTETGSYIVVSSVLFAKKGMRIYDVTTNIPGGRFLPEDTFITSIDYTNKRLYLSNDYDETYEPTITSYVLTTSAGLGSDKYINASNVVSASHTAGAVYFDYNPARKDIVDGEGLGSNVYDSLTYGFGRKYTYAGSEYIGLSVEKYQAGELPDIWFVNSAINQWRCIGFDKHFNAFGTGAILLTNGIASLWGGEYNASAIDKASNVWSIQTTDTTNNKFPPSIPQGGLYRVFEGQPSIEGWFVGNASYSPRYGPSANDPINARLFNEIYCGANQPSLQFDSLSSRFSFTNLHTPELIGTDIENIEDSNDVKDANLACYKLNKRLSRLNYSPDFIPYNNVFKVTSVAEGSASGVIAEKDNAITPYAIMDAQGGIFLEDYGCDEANWSQSLWELMGFTYSQFHNVGSRLNRFTQGDLSTSTPTTNANIKTEDLLNLPKAGSSSLSIFNTLEVNYPFWRYGFPSVSGVNASLQQEFQAFPGNMTYPAVSQTATSTTIEADNLPRKMLSPVYLIKSDILNPTFIGGREGTSKLPVIGVVDKSAGYGDFFNGATESTIFTNTIPRTIQNIKTSIVDADGSEARVDDGSLVIYKIQKTIKSNANVLENMMNPPKK